MVYIMSSITKKHQKIISWPLHSKFEENSRAFQGLAQKFKDFSSTSLKIQGNFKTVRTLTLFTIPLD